LGSTRRGGPGPTCKRKQGNPCPRARKGGKQRSWGKKKKQGSKKKSTAFRAKKEGRRERFRRPQPHRRPEVPSPRRASSRKDGKKDSANEKRIDWEGEKNKLRGVLVGKGGEIKRSAIEKMPPCRCNKEGWWLLGREKGGRTLSKKKPYYGNKEKRHYLDQGNRKHTADRDNQRAPCWDRSREKEGQTWSICSRGGKKRGRIPATLSNQKRGGLSSPQGKFRKERALKKRKEVLLL